MVGWWKDSATERDKAYLKAYVGVDDADDIAWLLFREAFKSVSRTSIVMMQASITDLFKVSQILSMAWAHFS